MTMALHGGGGGGEDMEAARGQRSREAGEEEQSMWRNLLL